MKKIISYVCIFCFCAFLAPSVSAMTTTIKVIPSDNIAISQQDYGISTSPILSAHPKRRQSKTRLYEPTISTLPILSAHPKRRQSKTRLYEPTISM